MDEVRFSLRLPEWLREAIAVVAAKNRRSVNSEMVIRLEDSLAKDGQKSDGPTARTGEPS